MSRLVDRLACLELAEIVLRPELIRTGMNAATSARVLSLAAALQFAVEMWYRDHADDGPDEEVVIP